MSVFFSRTHYITLLHRLMHVHKKNYVRLLNKIVLCVYSRDKNVQNYKFNHTNKVYILISNSIKSGQTHIVFGVHIGASGDQLPHEGELSFLRRKHKRRRAIVVAIIRHCSLVLEEVLQRLDIVLDDVGLQSAVT